MSATRFGLYVGLPQTCQYRNLTMEDIIKSKGRFSSPLLKIIILYVH